MSEKTHTIIADSETVARMLFVGVFPGGLSYADRTREESGDYARLAFLPYRTLRLETYPAFRTAPKCVRDAITASARDMEARRGHHYDVSAVGQKVMLGEV